MSILDDFSGSSLSQLFKVKKTQLEMMLARGYDISSISSDEAKVFEMDILQFRNYYAERAQLTLTGIKITDIRFKEDGLSQEYTSRDDRRIWVYYLKTPKNDKGKPKTTGIDFTKVMIANLVKINIAHVMLITETKFTSDGLINIKSMRSFEIEHFLYDQISYNPTKHALVPTHILLSVECSNRILKNNKLDVEKLPTISEQDPISRFFNAKKGQLFEIRRMNIGIPMLVNKIIVYRTVIDKDIIIPTSGKKKK